jgi:hypothetical protein
MTLSRGFNLCPACRRELPPEIPITGRKRQQLIECLRNYPNGRTVPQLMDYVYADDPDGGPEEHNIISVMVKHINSRITDYGWKIIATRGPGSTYHLKRL